jgi:cell division protein FtsB
MEDKVKQNFELRSELTTSKAQIADQVAELEVLRLDKTTLEKRLTDLQD